MSRNTKLDQEQKVRDLFEISPYEQNKIFVRVLVLVDLEAGYRP